MAARMKLVPVVGLAMGLMACGSASPTAPALTSPPPLVPPDSPRLTGVVLDDRGVPIAGVTVHAPTGSADETDDQGRFYVTSSAPPGASFGLWVYKEGYEAKNMWVRGPTEIITLHDIIRLPVGESLRVTVGSGESVDPDLEYHYRRLNVVSATPTAVELRVVADDAIPPDWVLHKGPCCPTPPSIVTSIDDVGMALVVELKAPFGSVRTYTVITRRLGP